MTHTGVGRITISGSDNGLSPGRRQAIIWTNAVIWLIRHLGTNFGEIIIEIGTFSFKKMHLKMSSEKGRPFCLGLNVLILDPGHLFGCFFLTTRNITVVISAIPMKECLWDCSTLKQVIDLMHEDCYHYFYRRYSYHQMKFNSPCPWQNLQVQLTTLRNIITISHFNEKWHWYLNI